MTTRRAFIQQFGVTLASAALAGCKTTGVEKLDSLFTPAPTATPTRVCVAFEVSGNSPRERLRSCWRGFAWLTSPEGGNCCGEAQTQLLSAHQAALKELRDAGQLSEAVSVEIEAAYGAALSHTWALRCRTVCYEPADTHHYSVLSHIVQRASVLDKMARTGELDPGTVAEVRKALERDLAFLDLFPDQVVTKRDDGSLLSFDELDLEITPEARAAAAFLVELLSSQ